MHMQNAAACATSTRCFPRALRASKLGRALTPGPVEEEEILEKADEKKMVVAIPIFKNVTALDLVGPYEVLHLLPNVRVVFVSYSRDLYAADLGMLSLHSTSTFDETPSPDIVVVPGGGGVHELLTDAPLLDWIRKAHATSLFTTSVCSGSLLLGAAGILKGVKPTTHWCVAHVTRLSSPACLCVHRPRCDLSIPTLDEFLESRLRSHNIQFSGNGFLHPACKLL